MPDGENRKEIMEKRRGLRSPDAYRSGSVGRLLDRFDGQRTWGTGVLRPYLLDLVFSQAKAQATGRLGTWQSGRDKVGESVSGISGSRPNFAWRGLDGDVRRSRLDGKSDHEKRTAN